MPTRFAILAALLLSLAACQSTSGSADDPTLNTNNADRSEADL